MDFFYCLENSYTCDCYCLGEKLIDPGCRAFEKPNQFFLIDCSPWASQEHSQQSCAFFEFYKKNYIPRGEWEYE